MVLALPRLAAVTLTVGLLSACAQSPTGPTAVTEPLPVVETSPATTVIDGVLTIRVLERGTEEPIASALVVGSDDRATTDASGSCTLHVVQGTEYEVNVSAPGYQPMGASAILTNNERWTFYLAPHDQAGAAASSLVRSR